MAHTTDEKDFVPLAALFRAAKKVDHVPNDPSLYAADAIFVMSPKTAVAVEQLCEKQDGTPITSIDDLHLPYNSIIVEMPLTPEVLEYRNKVSKSSTSMPVRRVGALMRQSTIADAKCVTFWPFWEFENGALGAGAICLMLAEGDNLPYPFKLMPGTTRLHQAIMPSSLVIHAATNLNLSEQQQLKFVDSFVSNPTYVDESIEEVSPLLFAWETLINCKSGITRTKVTPKPASRLLGRRKKIMANTEYTVISLTAVETVSNGQSSQRADVEAHLVRGHFKRRSSGVYWWNPFIRGTGDLKERKAYILEGV
jgi:hypothetical protein